jgi:tripartite-type tricarboxylate transporter receptor subunit TctC
MIQRVVWLIVLTFFLSIPALTLAEDYPIKAITTIVPLPPGGNLDLLARLFAPVAEKYIGKPVVVLNKTGAGGAAGSLAAAQAKPDGYTICWGWSNQTVLIIGESLAGRNPSFTIDDFIVLGKVNDSPTVLLVVDNSPWKTIQAALEDVKAHPNTYAFASGGINSITHLSMEILMGQLGLKIRHVPFLGGGPAYTALIGGHVDFGIQIPGPTLPYIKGKKLRALAQFGEKRFKNYEDIPTFKELGYNVVCSSWFGLLAPKGTPDPIIERWRLLVKQVTSDPTFMDSLEKVGDQVNYADAETMKRVWKEEYSKFYKVMEQQEKEKKQ